MIDDTMWEHAPEYVEMLFGGPAAGAAPAERRAGFRVEPSADVVEAIIGRIAAEIDSVGEPDVFFADGPAPGVQDEEEIWAAFVPTAF